MNSLQLVHITTTKRIKNGSYRFVAGFHENYPVDEVNHTN